MTSDHRHTDQASTRALRVLHVGKYFPPHRGGMETYLRDLMNTQARAGIQVAALVHSSESRASDTTETINSDVGQVYRVVRAARWFNIGFVPVSPLFLLAAFRLIRDFKPDLLHIHHPNASAAMLLLLHSARRLPWYMQWHADILTSMSGAIMQVAYRLYRPLEWLQLKKAKTVYATSPPYLAASRPLEPFIDKCELLPLGLDTSNLPCPTKPASGPGEVLTVLTVSRLTFYKGIDQLIRAMVHLPDAQLWVVGDGEDRRTLEKLTEELLLSERVQFWGAVEESQLWRLYDQCDVFCQPSKDRAEAFGIAQLEAAHFGKPVVTTRIPGSGLPWVTEHYGLGLTSNSNPKDIANTILAATQMTTANMGAPDVPLPDYRHAAPDLPI